MERNTLVGVGFLLMGFIISALSGFDFRLSAQYESDRNHGKTENKGIEYPQGKIVATRVAIIV
jgi:hypothetical protein